MLKNTKAAIIEYLENIEKPVIESQVNKMARTIIKGDVYILYYSLGETRRVEAIIKGHVNQTLGINFY